MKILILNPHIDAQHPVVLALKARGDAVLVSTQVDEGWKVLQVHGASIDLAVLHREGPTGGQPGDELNSKIKRNSTFADLPVLFTSEVWTDEQCAAHQQTPVGANAYLHWPFDAKKIIETIEAIFGPEAAAERPGFDQTHAPTLSIIAPAPKMDVAAMVLEDPSQIFERPAGEITNSGIKLSAFDGKAENTSVKLEAKIELPSLTLEPAPPASAPALQRSGSADVSKFILSSPTAPSFDLLDPSLASPPAEAQAASVVPSFEGALDLLSGDSSEIQTSLPPNTAAQVDPPVFNPDALIPAGPGVAVSPMTSSDLSIPTSQPSPISDIMQALEPPEMDETQAKGAEAVSDSAIESEVPYLFSKPGPPSSTPFGGVKNVPFQPTFSHPVGDSVVPGGAANAPDLETLKKYLLLREQDVSALSGQLKATREENSRINQELREEKDRAEGLDLLADDQKKKIEEFEREKAIALEALTHEIAELRFQTKAKTDKAKLLEIQVNEASQEIERLKDRVRSDIRKIRVRERELENQLEMSKKDTEVVLGAREGKIVELKRKIDLLEFNMDLLQDRFNRERESNNKLREKLGKAAQVVRVAEGLLDEQQGANAYSGSADAAGSLTDGKSNRDKAS